VRPAIDPHESVGYTDMTLVSVRPTVAWVAPSTEVVLGLIAALAGPVLLRGLRPMRNSPIGPDPETINAFMSR